MNVRKFWNIIMFLFLFNLLTNSLALAERTCTREVDRSGGTTTITTDCSSSRTQTEMHFWDRWFFNSMVSDLMDRVQQGLQNIRDRIANINSAQDNSKQFSANIREKEQAAIEAQQIKHQQQEIQLENLKDKQEMHKQEQGLMGKAVY